MNGWLLLTSPMAFAGVQTTDFVLIININISTQLFTIEENRCIAVFYNKHCQLED